MGKGLCLYVCMCIRMGWKGIAFTCVCTGVYLVWCVGDGAHALVCVRPGLVCIRRSSCGVEPCVRWASCNWDGDYLRWRVRQKGEEREREEEREERNGRGGGEYRKKGKERVIR